MRDWDKMKRQARAKKPELYPPTRQFKSHKPYTVPSPKVSFKVMPKDIERVLKVETTPFSLSRWRRTKGRWECLEADPQIEWFIRVRSPETIEGWLFKNHLRFMWLKTTSVCTAHRKQTEDIPAEAYPPNKASALSSDNTDTSLNNPLPDSVRTELCGGLAINESGLARTGLVQSLPLNPSPNTGLSC